MGHRKPCRKCGSPDILEYRQKRGDYICRECRNAEQRLRRPRRQSRVRKAPIRFCPSCSVIELTGTGKTFCENCARERRRQSDRRRRANGILSRNYPSISQYEKRRYIRRKDNPEWREKDTARRKFRKAVMRGILSKHPCAICGKIEAEGHHADYSKPLEVVWLCRKHHADLHAGRIEAPSITNNLG